jgi:hypothetical protein
MVSINRSAQQFTVVLQTTCLHENITAANNLSLCLLLLVCRGPAASESQEW